MQCEKTNICTKSIVFDLYLSLNIKFIYSVIVFTGGLLAAILCTSCTGCGVLEVILLF